MAHQPLVHSRRGVCASCTGDSPARQWFPLITVDCTRPTLLGWNGEAYLVFYPVVSTPIQISGHVLVAFYILCSHYTLRNRPAMPGMKLRKHTCTDRDTAEYANR